jgi:hypothetical protein
MTFRQNRHKLLVGNDLCRKYLVELSRLGCLMTHSACQSNQLGCRTVGAWMLPTQSMGALPTVQGCWLGKAPMHCSRCKGALPAMQGCTAYGARVLCRRCTGASGTVHGCWTHPARVLCAWCRDALATVQGCWTLGAPGRFSLRFSPVPACGLHLASIGDWG